MSKISCAVKIPKGHRRGTIQECIEKKQVRHYGIEAIDPDLLIPNAEINNLPVLRENLINLMVKLRGSIRRHKGRYENTKNEEIRKQSYITWKEDEKLLIDVVKKVKAVEEKRLKLEARALKEVKKPTKAPIIKEVKKPTKAPIIKEVKKPTKAPIIKEVKKPTKALSIKNEKLKKSIRERENDLNRMRSTLKTPAQIAKRIKENTKLIKLMERDFV